MTRIVWLIFAVPPAVLLLSGLVMLAVAPAAWGKAAHAGLDDWLPVAAALIFALPSIVIGGVACRRMYALRHSPLSGVSVQAWIGALFLLLAAAGVFGLALRIGDARTFDSLLDDNGNPNTVPAAFLAITVVVTAIIGGWVWSAAHFYVRGLDVTHGRFARRLDEPDYMDDYLHGRFGR